jgi:hypothetical protein
MGECVFGADSVVGGFVKMKIIGTRPDKSIPLTAQTLELKFDDQVFYPGDSGINNIQV